VDGETRDPRIDPAMATLSPMGVATMGAQRTDSFCGCSQTAQNLKNVTGDQVWQARAPR
jgi:hypothetical protein